MSVQETQLAKITPGTITPISYTPPPSLTIEGAMEIAERFRSVHKFLPWAIGDLMLWAQNHLGEEYSQLFEVFPQADSTVLRYLRLAEAYAPHQRKEGLTLAHHQVVMYMDHVDRESWLTLALHNQWTSGKLRQSIHRAQVKEIDPKASLAPEIPEEALHLLNHAEQAIAYAQPWSETEIVTIDHALHRVTLRVEIEKLQPANPEETSHGAEISHPEQHPLPDQVAQG